MKLPNQSQPVQRSPINITAPVGEVIGLGDAVKKVTGWFGFTPCGGCNKRANALNQWVQFTPKN
jgi:hypothetical protein